MTEFKKRRSSRQSLTFFIDLHQMQATSILNNHIALYIYLGSNISIINSSKIDLPINIHQRVFSIIFTGKLRFRQEL